MFFPRLIKSSKNKVQDKKGLKMIREYSSSSSSSESLINVNEEYLGAFRTNSYLEFFTKVQSLVVDDEQIIRPSSSSSFLSFGHQRFSEVFLEPKQDSIESLLESSIFISRKPDLKALFNNYFDISAEASKVCSHILTCINELQSHNQFIINKILDHDHESHDVDDDHDHDQLQFIVSEFMTSSIFFHEKNPLTNLEIFTKDFFIRLHNQYSLVLNHLNSMRRKIARRIKFINYFKKILSPPHQKASTPPTLKNKINNFFSTRTRGRTRRKYRNHNSDVKYYYSCCLRRVGEQLEVAARGTYILNRDFDTISRLVTRVHDEIEHNKEMMKLCLDKREDRFSLVILMKELKKNSDLGFKKIVEELEEQVYLCLVTINRARALVVNEITKSCCNRNIS